MNVLIKVLKKLKLLAFFNFTVRISVNKQVFKIPVFAGMGIYNLEVSEPWMKHVLQVLTRANPKGVYVDVGVNIGQTLIKLKSIAPKLPYIGFEPNAACVFYVKKLIALNNWDDVTIHPYGLSDRNAPRILSFFSNQDTDSSASTIDNYRPYETVYKREEVPCYQVSEILPENEVPQIGILKIDVEGGELEVLSGFESLIKRDRPFIQIEILPVYSVENKDRLRRQQEIESLLLQWKYDALRIHYKQNTRQFDRVEKIDSIGIHANMNWSEYLLSPREKTADIIASF